MIVEAVWDEVVALEPDTAQMKTLNDSLIRFVECSFGRKFIFIIDEWDAMIREAKDDEIAQQSYLNLLRGWFKSEQLFLDTIHRDEIAVAAQIEKIHAEETAPLHYNKEENLRSVIKLAYYTYRDHYIQMEELPAGEGYADIVYIPRHGSDWPVLVIELKWNEKAEGAVAQILKKKYPDAVRNIGCPILLIGISYDKNASAGEKKHTFRIVEL